MVSCALPADGAARAGAANPMKVAANPAAAAVAMVKFFMISALPYVGSEPWSESRGFDILRPVLVVVLHPI
jgi:hypothetical protein